jgi:hypothetical protein
VAPIELYKIREERPTQRPGFNALQAEDVVYFEYSTGERELYDLAWDPYQLDNLVASVDAGFINRLSERLAAMIACSGGACRVVEDTPLARRLAVR